MTDESTALVEADQIRVPARATSIDMHIDAASVSLIPTNLGEVVAFAQLMSRAGVAVPKHLREAPGACLAVSMQAFHWGMEPFAVANKNYSVNDRMAYEAQLIAAVVLKLVPHVGYPKYSYTGEGATRRCTVTIITPDGEEVPLESPLFSKINPKNSPLWTSDPDQQLGYYTIRAWARRHRPDVLLGVYDREEAASVPRDDVATSFETLDARAADAPAIDATADRRKGAARKLAPAHSVENRQDPSKSAEGETGPQGSDAPAAEGDKDTSASATGASGATAAETSGQQQQSPKSGDGEKEPENPKPDGSASAAADPAPDKGSAPAASSASTAASTATKKPSIAEAANTRTPKPDKLCPGFPLAGENYIIANEPLNNHKARNLYKDGEAVKSIHPSAATAYSAYAAHAEAEQAQEASQEGAEGESPSPATSDASPGPEAEDDALGAFGDYADAVAEANDWPSISHALTELMRTEEWRDHVPPREPARRIAYARVDELKLNIDMRTELKAWRCYVDWEEHLATLSALAATVHSMANPAWKALAEPARDALDRALTTRKHALAPTEVEATAEDYE